MDTGSEGTLHSHRLSWSRPSLMLTVFVYLGSFLIFSFRLSINFWWRYWLRWCRVVFVQVWRCRAAGVCPAKAGTHQPPVLPGSDWDEDVERRPVAGDCVVSPVRALPGDWWSPGWSCSPSSREAAVRLLCWCSTPARAGLLWLIALTSHCRQLSSPRPCQQNQ